MALFGKDDKIQRPDDARPAFISSPVLPGDPAPNEQRQVQAHLGQGSRIEGKLTFEGSVRIDGQIDGEIQAQETVIIGDTATVNAQISAGTVILIGRVTGDILARKRVEMRAPCKLTGNITTPSLVVHEGVVFEGHCAMGAAADGKLDKTDRKVTQFSREERAAASAARMPSEAIK